MEKRRILQALIMMAIGMTSAQAVNNQEINSNVQPVEEKRSPTGEIIKSDVSQCYSPDYKTHYYYYEDGTYYYPDQGYYYYSNGTYFYPDAFYYYFPDGVYFFPGHGWDNGWFWNGQEWHWGSNEKHYALPESHGETAGPRHKWAGGGSRTSASAPSGLIDKTENGDKINVPGAQSGPHSWPTSLNPPKKPE